MLKKTCLFFLIAGALLSPACSNSTDVMEVMVVDDNAFLIPSSVKSCRAKLEGVDTDDVSSDYFQFGQVYFKWNEKAGTESRFYFSAIQIEVESPFIMGGKISYAISGDELAALAPPFNTSGCSLSPTPQESELLSCVMMNQTWAKDGRGTMMPGQTLKISCPLTVGQVKGTQLFTATGTLKLYGFTMTKTGEKTPIQTQTFITVEKLIDN